MLAIAATTIFVACKKGEEKKETTSNTEMRSSRKLAKFSNNLQNYIDSLDHIGQLHNNGLDYWYNTNLNMKTANWAGNQAQYEALMKVEIDNYFTNQGYNTTQMLNTFEVPNTNLNSILSSEAMQILNSLDSVSNLFGTGTVSHSFLISYCSSKFTDCYNLTDDKESNAVGSYCAVMKASTQYWHENTLNWIILWDTPEPQYALNPRQKAMLRADAMGAIWGAITNAETGPGALLGAAIGGCYGSAKEAYNQAGVTDCWWCP